MHQLVFAYFFHLSSKPIFNVCQSQIRGPHWSCFPIAFTATESKGCIKTIFTSAINQIARFFNILLEITLFTLTAIRCRPFKIFPEEQGDGSNMETLKSQESSDVN